MEQKKKTSADVKVGAMFGRWLVLQTNVINPNSKAKNPPKMALCECQCPKKTRRYREYRDLYSGRSKSCGCLRSIELSKRNASRSSVKIGNVYGYLTVIENLGFRMQTRGNQESWYRCRCSHCGNENFEVSGNNLQSGNTTSCGCVNSRGEAYIKQLLDENNISYASQYTFSDLRSENGYMLKFDFALFKNNKLDCLIEFDGRQHYDGPEGNWKITKENIIYRDNLKNNYCKAHNIILKRIPYFEIEKISIQSLLDDTFTI